jgi:hypothetical protein
MIDRTKGLSSYSLMKPNVITLATLVDLLHFVDIRTIEIISQKSRDE